MVVFDTSVLLLMLSSAARPPLDPATGQAIPRAHDRVAHLVRTLSHDKEQIVIPTPVISEVLVHADAAAPRYLEILNGSRVFRIAPFDQRAAIEAALMIKDALDRGGLRVDAVSVDPSKAKVKFDRQIVAIAKVEGARVVYTDDGDIRAYAERAGLKAIATKDLDLPPEDPQSDLPFDGDPL